MADIAKYEPINGGTVLSYFKSHVSILRTKKTVALAYGFVFVFIAFTIFLAFSPSSNSSSPWFTNIFTATSDGNRTDNFPSSSSVFSDESYRSHFSSIFYYFFPNSSQSHYVGSQNSVPLTPNLGKGPSNQTHQILSNNTTPQRPSSEHLNNDRDEVLKRNQTHNEQLNDKADVLKGNQTENKQLNDRDEVSKGNQTENKPLNDRDEVSKGNQTQNEQLNDRDEVSKGNQTQNEPLNDRDEVLKRNHSTIGIITSSSVRKKEGVDDMIKSLMNCDLFDGNWVRDESYPLYKPGSCSLIDEQFNCFRNGRPDNGYYKLKWKPKGCSLPRLNGTHMLEMLRGKRMVFVGDSLNRNMWESLICILRNSVKDQKKVYEEFGRHHFRTEASYSFVFEDYKCTVEFFVSPFLVQEWEFKDKNGMKKETLRLDLVSRSADKFKSADVIVFNTGHWWTHEKTSKGKDYYQEGSHVYNELNVVEAFRKAITTWGRWVDANVDKMKSLVFFRGYSASHFSGGQWNSGGQCDHETEPIKNETYLSHYPPKMTVLEKVLRGMKTPVTYLNVTRMTDYRKDGHPSIYRKQHLSDEERRSPLSFQDCSHWCLPGVPDGWNEILYAELLVKLNQKHHS